MADTRRIFRPPWRHTMGAILAVVNQVAALATAVSAEVFREVNRSRSKAAARLKNPIKPPFFYTSLAARDRAEKAGDLGRRGAPYASAAIRAALNKGILPTGYSEEQLTAVGFGPAVKAFEVAQLRGAVQIRKDLGRLILNLVAELDDLRKTDPDTFRQTGATAAKVDKLRDVGTRAAAADATKPEDLVPGAELARVIKQIQTLSASATSVRETKTQLAALDAQEAEASQNRTTAVIALARAAFAPKTRAAFAARAAT